MYMMCLTPTPSFTSLGTTGLIGTRVAPFHPQVVLFTVTTLGIVLSGCGFKAIVVRALIFGSVAVNGVVAKSGTTGITPVLPLAPWSIGVTTNRPAT